MSIVIRKADKVDLPAILNLYTQFETSKEDILSLPEAEKMLDKLKQYPNYALYVAVDNDNVVGTFSLMVMDNLVHKGTPSAIADSVAVDPNYQGQGIGKQMMQHAMRVAANAGCYKLALSANFKWGAHEFYENLGFKQHGISFYVQVI